MSVPVGLVTMAYGSCLAWKELIKIIVDDAKNWLAHDGVWFQAVERRYGMAAAIDADTEAWGRFAAIEAKRIMERLGMNPGGGIPALVECLRHRFYARLNLQDVIEQTGSRAVFRMLDCRGAIGPEAEGPGRPSLQIGWPGRVQRVCQDNRSADPNALRRLPAG